MLSLFALFYYAFLLSTNGAMYEKQMENETWALVRQYGNESAATIIVDTFQREVNGGKQ